MREASAHLVLPMLADAIATLATLPRPHTPSAASLCALWTNVANEHFMTTDAYTELRQFSGPAIDTGANIVSVQAYTLGTTAAIALARSAKIFNALLDDQTGSDVAPEGGAAGHDRYPRTGWLIGTAPNQYVVDVLGLMEGGLIGVDDRKRYESVFNFELGYRRV